MIRAEDLLAEDAVSPNILSALRDGNRRTARFMRLGQAAIGKDIRSPFMNFITVAVDGGDFETITEALYSIDDASQYNPYTVQVYPGVPKEQYETKAWVAVVFLDKSEEEHYLSGGFTDNDPGAGFVSWAGITMTYAGTSYVVADGNTNQTYIYWELSAPNVFSTANVFPGITSDDIVVALNDAGIHRVIMMMGGLVSTDLIDDLAINADKLAALAVELGKIADGAVDEDALADLAVAMAKIQDGAVAEAKLAALSVALAKIQDGAVSEAKLAALSVSLGKIQDGAVSEAKLAALSVSLGKIQDGAVNEDKLAALAVTGPKIAASAVTAAKIEALTITAAEIAADTITAAKIAAGTITAAEIAALTITAGEIAADTITAAKIAADTITANEIAANAIGTNELLANAVTAAKIFANTITAAEIAASAITADELAANSVIAGKILAGAVTTNKINALAVNAGKIAADAIIASKIQANAVTTVKINAGAVTTDKMTVAQLSAIIADMGLLTAGEVRLGSGTPGVDFTGIRIYKAGAVYRVAGYSGDVIQAYIDSDGALKAGAGAVVIDAAGIAVAAGIGTSNKLRWRIAGADVGWLNTWESGGGDMILEIMAKRRSENDNFTAIYLEALNAAGTPVSKIHVDTGGVSFTDPYAGYLTLSDIEHLSSPLITGHGPDLTISAAGAITVTHSFHRVDTRFGAASDDLDTINGGTRGQRLVLMSVANVRVVTVRDGVGNIQCGANRILNSINDTIEFIARTATIWAMNSFASN